MKLFNKLIFVGNTLLILLTLGAYLAPYIPPNKSSIIAILGLGYPALLMANIACILYWLLFKSKWALASFFVLLVGINNIFDLIGIQNSEQANANTTTLKVGTLNMQFSKPIRSGNKKQQKVKEKAFRKYLAQFKDLDVLCLQEHSSYSRFHLTEVLQFKYRHLSKGQYVALYSRHPIVNKGIFKNFSENKANNCIWVDILVNKKDTVRVYSTHLEANQQTGTIPKEIVETAKEVPLNTSIALGILKYYQEFTAKRVVQAYKIRQHQKESLYPTILCGDMNDTPQTHLYKVLKGNQKDSFRENGKGLGATFGSTLKNKLANLRIDYIFTDPRLEVLSHEIFPSVFSDHYLVQSEIQL